MDIIERQSWRVAKTWAQTAPHEYIVRDKCGESREDWDAFVDYIWRHGQRRVFGRGLYVHWYAPDGYQYWTGWPVDNATIINRNLKERDQTRDPVPGFDYKYVGPEWRRFE